MNANIISYPLIDEMFKDNFKNHATLNFKYFIL